MTEERMTEEQVRNLAARLGHNISGSIIFGESIIRCLDDKDAAYRSLRSRLKAARKVWADPHSLAEMDEMDERGVEVYPDKSDIEIGDVQYHLVPVEPVDEE